MQLIKAARELTNCKGEFANVVQGRSLKVKYGALFYFRRRRNALKNCNLRLVFGLPEWVKTSFAVQKLRDQCSEQRYLKDLSWRGLDAQEKKMPFFHFSAVACKSFFMGPLPFPFPSSSLFGRARWKVKASSSLAFSVFYLADLFFIPRERKKKPKGFFCTCSLEIAVASRKQKKTWHSGLKIRTKSCGTLDKAIVKLGYLKWSGPAQNPLWAQC